MNEPILGYWIEDADQIYFVRGPQDALSKHLAIFNGPIKGVTLTPVTRHLDIAPYVVYKDKDNGAIRYNKWSPLSPVPLEHDHVGRDRFVVLDFAETIEEADAICKQLQRGN